MHINYISADIQEDRADTAQSV